MIKTAKKLKNRKSLSALFVVVITVAYLAVTAAFAQNGTLDGTATGLTHTYTRDYLSYGDLWAFSSDLYDQTNYGKHNYSTTYEYYADGSSSTTTEQKNASNFYGEVEFAAKSPVGGDPLDKHTYADFATDAASLVKGTMAGINGSTINTVAVSGANYGSYAVIPNDNGTYHVYVYYEGTGDPSSLVKYHVIESYTSNDAYASGFNGTAFTATGSLTFERVTGTNWWKSSEIEVSNNVWTARAPSVTPEKSTNADGESVPDKATGTAVNTELSSGGGATTYYYNIWSSTEVRFNSLIILQWHKDVILGPVSEVGTIHIVDDADQSDAYTGTITATNFFGEPVTTGTSTTTPHLPIYFVGHAEDGSQFTGFDTVTLTGGWYNFEAETLTLSGAWVERVELPTLSVTTNDSSYTADGDFYSANVLNTSFTMGTAPKYTITADFTEVPNGSVGYVISAPGQDDVSGTLTGAVPSFDVTPGMDDITVMLTENISGRNYTFTLNLLAAPDMSLPYMVQIERTGDKYQFIEDAILAATSGDKIIVIAEDAHFQSETREDFVGIKNAWTVTDANGNAAGYTIDEEVTLVLPYAEGCTTVFDSDDAFPWANYVLNKTSSYLDPQRDVYLTLTVPSDIEIVNNGIIAVGGQVTGDSTAGYAGATVGTHSNMILDGELKVGSAGILSVTGYILGEGSITTEGSSGAKIYQLFTVLDFVGGGYAVLAAGNYDGTILDAIAVPTKTDEDYITPFNRYAMLGIQTDLTITKGNYLYGYCDLYAGSQDNQTTVVIIGDSTTAGVLNLTGTGATLTASYDPNTFVDNHEADGVMRHLSKVGRTTMTITGGAALGSMKLNLSLQMGVTIDASVDTAVVTFPLPYNYAIVLEDGSYAIEYDFSLLPGASLTVGQGATLTVGGTSETRFTVYDGLFDHRKYKSSTFDPVAYHAVTRFTYPNTQYLRTESFGGNGMANLIVDGGTLELGAKVTFGGLVQTTGSGSLKVASGATVSSTVQYGVVGNENYGISGVADYNCFAAGATVSTFVGRVVDPHTGEQVPLVAGVNYTPYWYAGYQDDFTYTLYSDPDDASASETYTDTLYAQVQGAWYSYTATLTDGTDSSTGYFAHGADVSNYYTDAECTTAATTVTVNAQTYYYTSPVARVDWKDGSESTYYASLQSAVDAATHAGDVVVLCQSVELDNTIGISANQDITIDLNDYDITSDCQVILNRGRLTLNLNGGTISAGDKAMEVVYNTEGATMTITGGTGADDVQGVISNSAIGSANIISLNSGQTMFYAAAIRNEGTLAMENVTVKQTGDSTYNVALINFDTGVITSMTGVTVNDSAATNKGYAIYNLGATIERIDGCYIYGYYGVYNRNIRVNTQSVSPGGNTNTVRTVAEEDIGRIGTIIDSTIVASYRYAIYNTAMIDTITSSDTGATTITGVGRYAIYNDCYWYFDNAISDICYEDINGDGREDRTYYYDEENRPTVGTISGNVAISTPSYAVINAGFINSVNGNTVTITTTGSYGILNLWHIGEIKGKVTITSANYPIYNGILSDDYYGRVYTRQEYYNLYDADEFNYERVYDYSFGDCKIGTIGGSSGDAIKINSSADYGIMNKGDIDLIGRGTSVNMTSTSKTTLYGIYNSNARMAGYEDVITMVGQEIYYDAAEYAYANRLVTTIRYKTSTIDAINGGVSGGVKVTMQTAISSITSTAYRNTYAIYNAGRINTLKYATIKGTTHTVTLDSGSKVYNYMQQVIYNAKSGAYANDVTKVAYYYDSKKFDIRDNATLARVGLTTVGTIDYDEAYIGEISNCTISCYRYAVTNLGHIGSIKNTSITTSSTYAIKMDARGTYRVKYSVTAEEYAAQTDITADSFPSVTSVTYYRRPVLDLLGAGNTLKSTGNTIRNYGLIVSIDGGGTTKIQSTSSTSGLTSGAIVNSGCLVLTKDDGTTYNQGAEIGKISNVTITSKNYPAILNYSVSNYEGYTTKIGELGDGLIVYSSGNYAVYTNAVYGEPEITLISGGDYQGKSGRDYAIYLPDKQNYPEGYGLSANTRTVGSYKCYYVHKHTYTSAVTKPTCTEGGYTTHTCSVCTNVYTDSETEALGHDYDAVVTSRTCTQDGYTTYTCKTCGDSYVGDVVSAVGHDYVSMITHPTCVDGGYTTYTCDVCGDYYVDDEVAALGHTEVIDEAVEATCTENGLTAGSHCSVCSEVLVAQEVIAAVGHTAAEERVGAVDATCTVPGYTGDTVCTVCGETIEEGESIAALGHSCDETGACTGCDWFKFYGANVTLGNNLNMMFAFSQSAVEDWTGYYVEAVRQKADGTSVTVTYTLNQWTTSGGYYVVTYTGFAAKEMCDTITLTVYNAAGEAVCEPWTDSMRDYAMRMLKKAEDGGLNNLKTVIVDMLNYGAAAQTHFGYGTGDLANAKLSEAQQGYGSDMLTDVTDSISDQYRQNFSASNLTLESNIYFTMAFSGLTEGGCAVVDYTDHFGSAVSETVDTNYDSESKLWLVVIPKLVVADARQEITVTIYTDSTKEVVFTTCKDSVEAYLARLIEKEEAEEAAQRAIVEAFMTFADSAKIYLHDRNG